MKASSKSIVWIVLGLGAALVLVRAFRPVPVRIDVASIERATLRVTVDDDGHTRVRERYTISAPIQGRLMRTPLDPGDPVVARETVVAEFVPVAPNLLDARSRGEARAQLLRAEAALREAEARKQQAEADHRFATTQLQRFRQLHERNAKSREELDAAERDEARTYQGLRAAEFGVDVARYELELARASLREAAPDDVPDPTPDDAASAENERSTRERPGTADQRANADRRPDGDGTAGAGLGGSGPAGEGPDGKRALGQGAVGQGADGKALGGGGAGGNAPARRSTVEGELQLRSPIAGRVLRVFEESTRTLAAGAPILEVGNTAALEIIADYLSQDAVKVQPGMEVLVEGWGGELPGGEEKTLRGKVRVVEPGGFTKVSALGVEEQRVNVVVDPVVDSSADAADWSALGDGYRVELKILLWEEDDVLIVPTGALFREGKSWAVFVVEGGKAVRRDVRLGRRGGLEAQVLEGLAEGEQVVLYPSDLIGDGDLVEPR